MSAVVPVSFFGGAPGGGEILVILLAVLLLFGAKRLPEIARTLGRTLEEFRRAARQVRDEVMQSTDEDPAPGPEPRARKTENAQPPVEPKPADGTEPRADQRAPKGENG